ncbi:uncharacterized protein PG986_003801 [Apiospora aurea]|uniref:Uncharacterized protein n=1 Tax=Apiospora aurea TaxID=335848 RepID=A0ABR1QSS4_9PEZI
MLCYLYRIITTDVVITAVVGDHSTVVLTEQTVYTSYAQVPATSVVAKPADSSVPNPPSTSSTRSMAWVAGPAVGGVAAIIILAVLGFWWRRRGRRRRDRGTASGATQEIDGKEKAELAGSGQGAKLQGNSSGQPTAQELEARGPYRNKGANVQDYGVHEIGVTHAPRPAIAGNDERVTRVQNQ